MVQDTTGSFTRALGWLLRELNNDQDRSMFPEEQRNCPQLIPGLTSKPFWNPSAFPWLETLKLNFDAIREEVLALRDQPCFQVLAV